MNWPSKTKEIILLPASEQTGTGGNEIAVATEEKFCSFVIITVHFFTCCIMNLCTCVVTITVMFCGNVM